MGFVSYQEDIIERRNCNLELVEMQVECKETESLSELEYQKKQAIALIEGFRNDLRDNIHLREQLEQQKVENERIIKQAREEIEKTEQVTNQRILEKEAELQNTIYLKNLANQILLSDKNELIQKLEMKIRNLEIRNKQLQEDNTFLMQKAEDKLYESYTSPVKPGAKNKDTKQEKINNPVMKEALMKVINSKD